MPPTKLGVWPTRQAMARATADILAALASFATAFVVAEHARGEPSAAGLVVLLGLLLGTLVVFVFAKGGLYRPRITVLNLLELRSVLRMAFIAGTMFLAVVLVTKLFDVPRWALAFATGATLPALLVERRIMAVLRAKGHWLNGDGERTLVYGYNEAARLLMKKIVQAPQAGRTLVGFVDDFVMDGTELTFRVDRNGSPPFIARLLGRTSDLDDVVREYRVTEVLISSPDFEPEALVRVGNKKARRGVHWGIAAQFGGARPDELVAEDVGAIPVLYPVTPDPNWPYLTAKRVLDVCVALGLILLTWPLWLVIAAAIRLESGSPVLFCQDRVGEDGRRFVMLKFRSLRTDVNPYQSSTSLPEDQATRVGRILRATTLDELPQLLNVLKGDMSLVGPRPEMPFLVERYNDVQARRLSVKPGVTGVWQLSADRHGMEIHENIEFDLFYVTHQSFLLDVVILFETGVFTAAAVLRAAHAAAYGVGAPRWTAREQQKTLDGAYVFVALDQRHVPGLEKNWAYAAEVLLPGPMHVRALASDRTIAVLREVIRDLKGGERLADCVQFVPYKDGATLKAVMRNASLVVTDVEAFRSIAASIGIRALSLSSLAVGWQMVPSAGASGRTQVAVRH